MAWLDYDGLLYFWQKIKSKLDGKVDKVTGKGLSTNDYTTGEKNKLAGLSNYTHPTSSGNKHLVELMVQRGELTHEQAKNHPSKNLITRAVGTEKQVAADVFSLTAEPGDCLLLCSDGLSNQMADQEILFEVVHGAQKADCCQRLLDIAKSRGAPDNVTSVLIAL